MHNQHSLNLPTVGDMLRAWRQRRRLSQLALALNANVSARHLSFIETGRAAPSRAMVLHLAEQLEVPLRERNLLLVAAGFAPAFAEPALADVVMAPASAIIAQILTGHGVCPALAVDGHWNMLHANMAVTRLLVGIDPDLLRPPINVLRLALHPGGLAPRTLNYAEWRHHLLARLRQQAGSSGDPVLLALHAELMALPPPIQNLAALPRAPGDMREADGRAIAVPLQLQVELGVLNLISTTTVFGTPQNITLSELAIEAFFPADPATAALLRQMEQ